MGNIHVVIDSTANAGPELLQKYKNLHRVSLKLILGGREWEEDELSAERLFSEMALAGAFPKTSQPAVGEFIKIFEPIVQSGGEAIVLTISGGLSGTADGARTAAKAVGEKKIRVIDTKTTAWGITNMAEQALTMIEAGLSADDIAGRLQEVAGATHTLFLPDSLEHLHKGGRIGGASAIFGALLQIKPVLCLTDGKITVLDKVRTRAKAVRRMIEEVEKCGELSYLGIVHTGEEAECAEIKARLEALYPSLCISAGRAGAVLATHAGPSALAFMYQKKLG